MTRAQVLAPIGIASLYARVPARGKHDEVWSFGRKFDHWLTDNRISLNAFAKRHGFVQSTLQRWVKAGVKVPAGEVARIAGITRLPTDYWLDDTLPWPPPTQYANLAERVERALQAVPLNELYEILEMVENAEDRRKTLALRRTARA